MGKRHRPAKKNESPEAEKLRRYLLLMEAENLQELEISDGGTQIRLVRQGGAVTVAPAGAVAPPPPASKKKDSSSSGLEVRAPIAGVFYRSPSPSAPAFVSEGDSIKSGQVLCIIEAMKVMNEVTAESAGRISKIMVENGKPIEAGRVLFVLEPK